MKTVTATLTIRVVMSIPDTMSAQQACDMLNYDVTGDEDDLIEVEETYMLDAETADE